jgi:hypothetical protein
MIINKRRLALLSTLSVAPAFAAPFLAIGDNAELFLTGRTEARYEDNVTLSDINEREDVAFAITPGIELLFGKDSLTKGSFAVQETFNIYSDNDDLNSELTNVALEVDYSGAKLELGANAAYRQLNQNTRGVANIATLVRRDVYEAGVDAEYSATEKSKIGVGANYSQTEYKRGGGVYFDQTNYSVPVDYYFAIAPKLDLSAGIQYRNTDVDAPNADSEDYYFNIGARGEFTPKLSGRFSVGYNLRESDNPTADGESGIGVKTGLNFAYSPKTAFTLDLSKDFETGSDANSIDASSIAVGASTSITAAVSANASLSYGNYDYITAAREDEFIVASLGVTYTHNAYVSFDAGYSFQENDSNAAGSSFTANVIRVAANFRY